MKRVLAVSDDAGFHEFLRAACRAQSGFQVVSALTGWEALTELNLRPASLAILDFNAATWDAYQVLGEIRQRHAELSILGLTRTPGVAVERRMKHAGPVRMLHREVAPESLLEEMAMMLEGSAKGHIEGLQLSSLLQVLDWERKHCTVRVRAEGRSGLLHFHRGHLIHAEAGVLSGAAAAVDVLMWDDASIEFRPPMDVPRSIELPLKEILLLAAQTRDEADRQPVDQPSGPDAWWPGDASRCMGA